MSQTQPDWKKPLALAILLSAIGYGAYWNEFMRKPKLESQDEVAKKLISLKDVTIMSVRLINEKNTFKLSCVDFVKTPCRAGDTNKWEMSEPTKMKADDGNVNALLSAINNLVVSESIDLSIETPEKRLTLYKEYGLTPEQRALKNARRIEIEMGGGRIVTAYFGETHPVGDQIFVTLADSDQKIRLVGSYFKVNFEKDLTYWRDKKLFSLIPAQVTSLEVLQANQKDKIKISKKDANWIIEPDLTGDIEGIDGLVSATTYLAAKGFASDQKNDAKAKRALSGAKRITQIKINDIVFELFEKGKDKAATYFATVSNLDPLFEMDPSTKKRVDKTMKDLRLSKLITTVERFSAKKVEISGKTIGEPSLMLANKEGGWVFEKSASGPQADTDKVQALLDKMSGNRIEEFLPLDKAPKGEDTGTHVALFDESGAKKREIVFWQAAGKVYARDVLAKRPEAFRVDAALKDAVPWNRAFINKGTK